MTWFVIHTKPRQEKRALDNLENQNYRCYLPTITIEKLINNHIEVCVEPLFSRYLFINIEENQTWAPIRSTKGVSNIVSFGGSPAKVSDELITELHNCEQGSACKQPSRLYTQGERVQITDGPFAGLEGVFQMNDGEARAFILIEILRKPLKLRLDINQMQKAG